MTKTNSTSTIQPRFHDQLKNLEGYSLLSSFEYDLEESSKNLDRLGRIILTWTSADTSALKVRNERYKSMKAEKDALEAKIETLKK